MASIHPARRFLPTTTTSSTTHIAAADPPEAITVDSDVVVILAALLCALICVVGLALVARCAWLRRSGNTSPPSPPSPPTNKGLKKKALRSLPTVPFDGSSGEGKGLADCAICLAEFAEGERIRILPQCGHGFHADCVDAWLLSHSSCPSCRRVLVVAAPPSRCRMCGATSNPAAVECGAKARQDVDANSFLP